MQAAFLPVRESSLSEPPSASVRTRSTLEDWILVGLQLKHPLPVIEGIDLNKEPAREQVDAV